MIYSWVAIDELQKQAQEIGLDPELVRAALSATDMDAARMALKELKNANRDPYFVEAFACAILDRAVEQESQHILAVCSILLDLGEAALEAIVELSKLGSTEALALIRQALTAHYPELREAAASAVIMVQYREQASQALVDDMENVRVRAATQLEHQNNAVALMQALHNTAIPVRRIAAWYMGRKSVNESAHRLMEMAQVEDDAETLRAAIWSLGMLQIKEALPLIQRLTSHQNPLVATMAQHSIVKLGWI